MHDVGAHAGALDEVVYVVSLKAELRTRKICSQTGEVERFFSDKQFCIQRVKDGW